MTVLIKKSFYLTLLNIKCGNSLFNCATLLNEDVPIMLPAGRVSSVKCLLIPN